MASFAVIKTGGKQYIAEPGKKIKVEKLPVEEGKDFLFEDVLLVVGGKEEVKIGTPLVMGTSVSAKVIHHGRHAKITNLRYHSKTRHRRKKGHRQWFTEIEITAIK
ncbi:MAG: large subunit ribosomal protein L21 [Parcubacteria group bacterium Gr01-1014_70]|nr:MAG: large subunit ribosomal protein L21 [Parcubacteria group bacterium Gr01-1014_70]